MKIAIAGPLDKPITKMSYTGTELWTYNYVEGLYSLGYDVTLYCLTSSDVSCKMIQMFNKNDIIENSYYYRCSHIKQALQILNDQFKYDIIHISVFCYNYYLPFLKYFKKPILFTLHSPYYSRKLLNEACIENPNVMFVCISDFQKMLFQLNTNCTRIYNSVNQNSDYTIAHKEDFFLFIGRICHDKGIEDAINAIKEKKYKIIIAGPIEDIKYYEHVVLPYLNEDIKYIGILDNIEKNYYYSHAKATIVPSKWNEPFGLVIIESILSGTPVIGYNRGAISEIVIDGVNGIIVEKDNIKLLSESLDQINSIDPKICKNSIKDKFNYNKMIDEYLKLYHKLIKTDIITI